MDILRRILLADPDEQLLDEYCRGLRAGGFEVETATDALMCVERLKQFDPDLLVLEPMIPWGQGEGILSYMREEADVPLVPVVVLTCGTDLLEEYQLPRFPVLERHQKPLSIEALLASVRHLAAVTSHR
jgi:DNA-binding response OmpR family regulator